jgi:hypothetical protein
MPSLDWKRLSQKIQNGELPSFDRKKIFQKLQNGEWPNCPLYYASLQQLSPKRRNPRTEMSQRLDSYRAYRTASDARRQIDPVTQAVAEAFKTELLDLVAEPGIAHLKRLLRAGYRSEEKKTSKYQLALEEKQLSCVPVSMLLGVIYLREECQQNSINTKALRDLVENDRSQRIDDRYWNRCLKKPALQPWLV